MRRSLALALACGAAGCSLFSGVKIETLGTAAQRPGNVAAYVAVSDGSQPVTELLAKNFVVYEDDQALSAEQTRQLLLDRDLVATHRTLLAVDVSLVKTSQSRAMLNKAVAAFVEKVRPSQAVTVLAFGGSTKPRLLAEYEKAGREPVEVSRLIGVTTSDQSRDLNGAVSAALKELDARLALSRKPIHVGTLVVFASGPDRAQRTTDDQVEDAVEAHPYSVFAIGIGDKAKSELRAFARDGFVAADTENTLPIAFDEAATQVRDLNEKYYLFAYCSPARRGKRELRLEVRFTDKDGSEKSADTETTFDTAGFRAGCDPHTVPALVPSKKTKNKETTRKPTSPEPERAEPERTEPSEPTPPSDGADDGPVVPPPKRSGYAQ